MYTKRRRRIVALRTARNSFVLVDGKTVERRRRGHVLLDCVPASTDNLVLKCSRPPTGSGSHNGSQVITVTSSNTFSRSV
jgi:hypothetical protein